MTLLRGRFETIVPPAVISILVAGQLTGQVSPDRLPRIYAPAANGWARWIGNPYRPREVSR